MPKKKKRYLSKKEKEARLKKILLVGGGVFLAAVAAAIVLGVVFTLNAPKDRTPAEQLRRELEEDYGSHPWDGADAGSVDSKQGTLWVVYEALMAIEDDAYRQGSEGVIFNGSVGSTLCFNLSGFDDQTRSALEKMLSCYAEAKGQRFRTGSLEDLKSEGKTAADDAYTEGCLVNVGVPVYEEDLRCWHTEIYFYYSGRNGRGATVASIRREDFDYYTDLIGTEPENEISDDGAWISYIETTMIS